MQRALPPVRTDIDCLTAQRLVRLPGLVDVHVHVREPGATHKEDWTTATAAALAGGVTMILAMPNTNPTVTDSQSFEYVKKVSSSMSMISLSCCLTSHVAKLFLVSVSATAVHHFQEFY